MIRVALFLLLLAMGARAAEPVPLPGSFIALAYHNAEFNDPDQSYLGVTTAKLVAQLSWLQRNGYTPVSIDDLLAAREGRRPLPPKAVLLSFDDGYESFYTQVLPILKAFRFPAVLALVGSWMEGAPNSSVAYAPDRNREAPGGGTVQFGDSKVSRDLFLTWDQVREIAASGLVEIASHSYGEHRGQLANPQGNSEPDVTTRRYDKADGAYERDAIERADLERDSARMAAKIQKETGKRPRVMVWPYGEHSQLSIEVAAANGMPITLSLVDGMANLDRLFAVPRHLITPDPNLAPYVAELRTFADVPPVRVVQVDLDYVYDADPAQQEANVGRLVQRVYDMQISTVFLQAFADPAGDGLARSVYFPNRLLPVRADLFNRVAWQLRTRAHVAVYAWMPVLAYDLPGPARVQAWDPATGRAAADPKAYPRLSPFDPSAREKILMLYDDLARAAPIEGLLFHDDATLSDFEDASPPALLAYAKAGLPGSIAAIRADPDAMRRWTRFKTDALIAFTGELAARARIYRTPLPTARSMYAAPVLDPASEAWFAQDLDRFLASYDYTAVMAMPAMENVPAGESDAWLRRLVASVAARPLGLRRTIFELQATDWRGGKDAPVPAVTLLRQMRLLLGLRALNFGYYPDDFIGGLPDQKALHPALSLQSYPFLQ